MRVLVTGAAGNIGTRLAQALQADHELVLGDVRSLPDEPRWIPLDVTDYEQVHRAVGGVDAVVHLAIAAGREGEFEEAAFNQRRFDVNVKGTWNVLEAARHAGVRRVVHTSSMMVVWGYPPPQPVASDAPARPEGTYAVTKLLAENLCEYYARAHGLSIVCLRISKPIDLKDSAVKSRPIRPQWIAFPDLMEAYRCALAAPDIGYEVVTVVGDSSRGRWDLSKAERVLGYRPQLRLEDLGYKLGDEREPLVMP